MRQKDPAKYYEGKPCKNCGGVLRLKSSQSCVACQNKRTTLWKQRNPIKTKEWHQGNRDRINEQARKHYQQNPDPRIAQSMRWKKDNPDRYKHHKKVNQHKRRSSQTVPYTTQQLIDRLALFNNCCVYCGTCDNITIDHFLPLALGGINALHNLVPACSSCNSSKNDSEPVQWMQGKGYSDRHITTLANLVLELAKNA